MFKSAKQFVKALRRGQVDLRLYMAIANERGSFTVTESFVNQYHTLLQTQYQQEKSQLENLISPMMVKRNVRGELSSHERLGAVIANDMAERHGDTKYLNPAHTRRWARLVPSDGAVLLDQEDDIRTLVEPVSPYRSTVSSALGRRGDKHIIDAAVGTAITGKSATGTQALPSGQKIALGSSPNDTLTKTKIEDASVKLDKASVPPGPENRIALYSPGQSKALLNITEAQSSDFTKNQIRDRGSMNGVVWMGFLWVMIPDLQDPDGTNLQRMLPLTGTTRDCIFMGRGAVGLSIGSGIKSYIDVLPQKNHATQVRSVMDMGAVRVWDTAVVQVSALEQ